MNTASTANSGTLLLLVTAGLMLLITPGCLMLDGKFTVNVDGSTDVQMTVAIARSLMEQAKEEGDPVEELRKGAPEGWTVQAYDTEQWHGAQLVRRARPGETLLPPAENRPSGTDDLRVSVVQRLLCTDYRVEGKVDLTEVAPGREPAGQASASPRLVFVQEQAPNNAEPDGSAKTPDLGDMAGLLGALSQKPQLTFRVKSPGSVLTTTGTVGDDGMAVWDVPLKNDGMVPVPEEVVIRHTTRLVNQQNVGRLADQLAAEKDMGDMASLISDCVVRDLLPNPPKADPLKATLDVQAYHDALLIVSTLQDAFGNRVAEQVVRGLRLNADNVTAKRLAEVWNAVSSADQEELVAIVADGLITLLRSRQK